MQGYLAHKKQPPPPRTPLGPQAWSYCRVLRGGVFIMSEVSLYYVIERERERVCECASVSV